MSLDFVVDIHSSSVQSGGGSGTLNFIIQSNPPLKHHPLINLLWCLHTFILMFIIILLTLLLSSIFLFNYTIMIFIKWPTFLILICCNFLLIRRIVTALVFLIERHFVIKGKNTLSFVFALETTVFYFFYSTSLLLSWLFLINLEDKTNFIHHFITTSLSTYVVATATWILKIVFLKLLAFSFYDKILFEENQYLIIQEYALQTLLGLSNNRYNTICDALHNTLDDEHQVETLVSLVFRNLAVIGQRYIQEADLLKVMKKDDVDNVLKMFQGAEETNIINEASLRSYMVKVGKDRKTLVHILNESSTVIKELNYIITASLLFSITLVWLLFTGYETTKVLVFITSHLLGFVYICRETFKTICEGIIFVFIIHPFDIGDRCIIDDEQMVVEQIGIIRTVFLKVNNDKAYYPNSVLATKSISNFNRSPEMMDTLELLLSIETSHENIAALKLNIDELLGSKPESWCLGHRLQLTEIDDSTLKFALCVTHAINFQNYMEKNNQRSELVFELKRIFDELGIKCLSIQ